MKLYLLACIAALCSILLRAAPAPDRPTAPKSDKDNVPDMIGPYVIRSYADSGFAGMPEPTEDDIIDLFVSPSPEVMMITPSPEVEQVTNGFHTSPDCNMSSMYPFLQMEAPTENRDCNKSFEYPATMTDGYPQQKMDGYPTLNTETYPTPTEMEELFTPTPELVSPEPELF